MAIGQTRILGADLSANNSNGTDYLPTLQVSTGQRSKLHKVVVSNLGAADVYLWVFDLAAGTGTSANPRMVVLCPAGACTTLDLSTGKPFTAGIFLGVATNKPANATTAMTAAGNDAAIVDADYRLE